MAEDGTHRHRFLLFLLSLLAFSTSSAVARHLPPRSTRSTTTATLDVSATLALALRALSFDPVSSHHPLSHNISSSAISLPLHSRDFLPSSDGHRHPDYKALTLARLRRDAARVRSIAARAALAVGGVAASDLKPIAEEKALPIAAADSIEGPVVSGTSLGSGEYFSRVGVGSPAKPLYMVLDTGSDVSWIQCAPCADCYQQTDPVFDPSASSSYVPLSCDSSQCRSLDISACRNSSSSIAAAATTSGRGGSEGNCLYQVSYGDGSYTVGDFATETVTLGGSDPVSGVAIGCGHDNEGLFVGAAGLLALGGGPLSFPSQISARSFSYCLVDRDSPASSTLDFSAASAASHSVAAPAVTAPLLRNRRLETFYYVGVTGISVGGEMLSIPPSAFAVDESGAGGVIVDSGTAVTRLQEGAYSALRDAFRAGTASLPSASGVSLFDTCYDLSSRTSVEVPTVGFHFPGGRELRLPAKNYLIPVDGAGTYCLAFAPTSAPLSIIGNVQQQGTRVSFDLENASVAFTPNKC
ncbi:protein ASPARTIC PROTEASE IN GUARD CELL 1-like [Musa acuminata AAA Group]|uniref:protein ASPARTIC PROTEASE IN GUARD CELL 1-like n=1 Tax=Musa acuminata AAA Group TaxID=214697 RepID=UPI0031CE50A2